MGLSVRDDPKHVVDVSGRTWGKPVNGMALSVLEASKVESDDLITVTVAIHNQSADPQTLHTHGWLHFLQVAVIGPDGVQATLTPYGGELMKPERQPALGPVTLGPGEATEADIPIGSIYKMSRGAYNVQASAQLTDGTAVSNEIRVTV